ncbi:MAG: murein biosynthesis integral membrane protein MurJ [Phycisphaeraceae bacterium]|nr:murein biosynthesis integral membrane protein MurJ [Phycisphaeraceae bacterium]
MTDRPIVVALKRWARPLLAVYWPALFVATHWPGAKLGPPTDLFNLGSDKFLHFATFAFLTLLLYYAQLIGRRHRPIVQLLLVAVLASVYSFADELTQALIPNRSFSLEDIAGNLVGTGAAMLVLLPSVVRFQGGQALVWIARVLLALSSVALLIGALLPNPKVAPYIYKTINLPLILPLFKANRRLITVTIGLDKLLHVAAMIPITWLLLAAQPCGRSRRWLNRMVALIVLVGSGPGVEWLQNTLADHRHYETDDVIAHEIGVGIGLITWFLFVTIPRWIRARRARAQAGAESAGEQASGFVGHAVTVSALTLLSRITGLVRDSVLAATLGLGAVADSFYLAFLLPNLFRRLFGEGALTAAFIPHYAELLRDNPPLARRLASAVIAVLLIVLGLLTLLSEGVLWYLHSMPDLSINNRLTVDLAMIMLPYMPLVCLVAFLGGILQVHRRFGPSAAAPILLNVAQISAALFATAGIASEDGLREAMPIVAISVLVAGVLQLLWQLAALGDIDWLTVHLSGVGTQLRSMLKMMLPMILALSIFQINSALDSLMAYFLAPRDGGDAMIHFLGFTLAYPTSAGDVAALQLAQRLYQFPLGVFGVAIATAIFPALAEASGSHKDIHGSHFARILANGMRLTFFIGLPASVGLILVRLPLSRVIFQYNQVQLDDTMRVAGVLAGYSAGIWAFSGMQVLTRAFYAVKDVRTPLRISIRMVVLNFVLNISFIWVMGVPALAWSTTICAVVQVFLLLRALAGHGLTPMNLGVWKSWRRTALVTAVMAAVLWPVVWFYDPAALSRGQAAIQLAVMVGLGMVVFLAGSWLSGGEEMNWLLRRRHHQAQAGS